MLNSGCQAEVLVRPWASLVRYRSRKTEITRESFANGADEDVSALVQLPDLLFLHCPFPAIKIAKIHVLCLFSLLWEARIVAASEIRSQC